jgi:hypothetical protein
MASWVWNTIPGSRDMLGKGACWKIGNGVALDIWNASWVPHLEGFKPNPSTDSPNNPNWVPELVLQNPIRWDKK